MIPQPAVLLLAMSTLSGLVAGDAVTTRPAGEYRVLRLELSAGFAAGGVKLGSQTCFLATRGGAFANIWFVGSGSQRINLHAADISATPGAVTGALAFRTFTDDRSFASLSTVTATWDLKIAGNAATGTYRIATAGKDGTWEGTATGEIVSAQSALPDGPLWPRFGGPDGDFHVANPPMIDDLSGMKPVWRSEATLPVSYGNGPDSRYFWRAAATRAVGGAASPVVCDNTVYVHYYQPSRQSAVDEQNPLRVGGAKFPGIAKIMEEARAKQLTPDEIAALDDHFRQGADDILVAIDAATGATRWTCTVPLRSSNHQTHKHRGISATPLAVKEGIFWPNLHGRLYATDPATGVLRWEYPAAPPTGFPGSKGPPNPSPLLLAGAVVWSADGGLCGLDPQSGEVRWQSKGANQGMTHWRHQDRELVLAADHATLRCVDPADGKELWKAAGGFAIISSMNIAVAGDIAVIRTGENKGSGTAILQGWRLALDGAQKIWDAPAFIYDEHPYVIASGKVAWAFGKQLLRTIDLDSGATLADVATWPGGSGPGSNPFMMILGGKLLMDPEGQHGSCHYLWMTADAAAPTLLGAGLFHPPMPLTCAYNSQPLTPAVVDGRMFVRGGDGLYCYDLRK